MPDLISLPDLHYLPFDKTSTGTSTGSQREVDDYQPRAQAKNNFKMRHLHQMMQSPLKHFQKLLLLRKVLRESILNIQNTYNQKKESSLKKESRKKKEEVRKTYNDFDWVQMFLKGTISKLTVPILNLFPDEHQLRHGKMKKAEKVNMTNAWLPNSEYHKIQRKLFMTRIMRLQIKTVMSLMMRIMQFYKRLVS